MNPHDKIRASQIARSITRYQGRFGPLPGLLSDDHLETLVAQLIDSLRRVKFAHHIRDACHDIARMDPGSDIFDPLRAAVLHHRNGNIDEAWWLVFLSTHFGKHSKDGWRLTRDVYGKLGQGGYWDWPTISAEPPAFVTWLAANQEVLQGADGISRRFSNHRKYESLKATSPKGTAATILSYISWIDPPKTHRDLIENHHKAVGQNPNVVFAALFESMNIIQRFGRLAKFDFLAMIGKLGIAPIEPGSTFLQNATGPLAGARLLFAGTRDAKLSAKTLENTLKVFGEETELGAQVLEDAICNWQKSPNMYVRFRG